MKFSRVGPLRGSFSAFRLGMICLFFGLGLRASASGEFKVTDTPGKTVYVVLLSATSTIYNQTGTAFETLADANWTATKYGMVLTQKGASQIYAGNMPVNSATVAGRYSYIAFEQQGANEAEADPIIGQGAFDWSGTAIAGIGTHTGTDGKTLLSINAQTGVTIPTITTLTGNTAQTGDNYARLGAPVGASISADIANVQTTATNNGTALTTLTTRIGTPVLASLSLDIAAIVGGVIAAVPGNTAIATDIATALNTPGPGSPTAGSPYAYLKSAGSAGDPWVTLLTSESTAGSFGSALKSFMLASPSGWLAADTASLNAISANLLNTAVEQTITFKQSQEVTLALQFDAVRTYNLVTHVATDTWYRRKADLTADLTKPVMVKTIQYDATDRQPASASVVINFANL